MGNQHEIDRMSQQLWKIVETDNFGSEYPNEKFVNIPAVPFEHAYAIAEAINRACSGDEAPRYWTAHPEDYTLQPGFEP